MFSEIAEFGDFAELKFTDHLFELYRQSHRQKPLPDCKTMTEAYITHQKLLRKELDQKLETLTGSKNSEPLLRDRLIAIKKKYEGNLLWAK